MLNSEAVAQRAEILAYRSPLGRGDFVSAAFQFLLANLKQKPKVLDLGFCSNQTLTTFSFYRAKITFEDVSSAFEGGAEVDLKNVLLDYSSDTQFDLIFAWDVLNYFTPADMATLFKHLAQYSHRGTRLHALLSTLFVMPVVPGHFNLNGQGQVSYSQMLERLRECPRYSPRDLEKLAPDFKIDRLVLLQNGFYEIIFRPL